MDRLLTDLHSDLFDRMTLSSIGWMAARSMYLQHQRPAWVMNSSVLSRTHHHPSCLKTRIVGVVSAGGVCDESWPSPLHQADVGSLMHWPANLSDRPPATWLRLRTAASLDSVLVAIHRLAVARSMRTSATLIPVNASHV